LARFVGETTHPRTCKASAVQVRVTESLDAKRGMDAVWSAAHGPPHGHMPRQPRRRHAVDAAWNAKLWTLTASGEAHLRGPTACRTRESACWALRSSATSC